MAEGAPSTVALHLVLGTAGHVDHGKTSLVKAVTGIDCDTLTEEKQRGITINLGFAYLDLPLEHRMAEALGLASGVAGPRSIRLGIVDVPGHARFIRNMVAGASGIDLVMLVVAADDGVMPQTVEHLQICTLLGVRSGLVALTKADLVEPELLELAAADVRTLLAGTFLDGCPVIPVSTVTGAGLLELREALAHLASNAVSQHATGRFRLAIDRAFTVKGTGTVVTGTALGGTVRVGDELEVLPAGGRVRVRGLQVHGTAAASATAGQRVALNVTGVDKAELQRGTVLAELGTLHPTHALDCELLLLPGRYRALRSGSAAELHIGTSELPVVIRLLAGKLLAPSMTGLVQLQSQAPLSCAAGDRYILRSSDGTRTLGGGMVLDPQPPRHIRQRSAAARQLAVLDVAQPAARLLHELGKQPYGLSVESAAAALGWSVAEIDAAAAAAAAAGVRQHGAERQAFLTAPANRERLVAVAAARLEGYHAVHPLSRRGLSAVELAAGLSNLGVALQPEIVTAVLDEAVRVGTLTAQLGTYGLPGRAIQLTAKDNQALKVLLARTRQTLTPPQPDELLAELPVDKKRLIQLVSMLVEDDEFLAAPGPVYFDPAAVDGARQRLLAKLTSQLSGAGISIGEFNALVGTTRKFGLPLLHLFENEGTLVRDGDLRRLRL